MNDFKTSRIGSFFTAVLFFFSAAFFAQEGFSGVCWKSSYGRGVGTIPDNCPAGQTKSGALCYNNCRDGFYNVAGVCWQGCPKRPQVASDYRDDGAFCRLPEYGRGSWVDWEGGKCDAAARAEGIDGCEKEGLIWYKKCKPGYHKVGCCICAPDVACPAGWKEVAGSCEKQSYVEAPKSPNCGSKQEDAGLCYTPCKAGYKNVGPVCWGQCPIDKPIDCGAMCATTAFECGNAIGDMVLSVANVAAKVASTIATLGAATGVSAAIDAAKEAAINSLKEVAKKVAKDLVKLGAGAVAKQGESLGLPPAVATGLAYLGTDPDKFDVEKFFKTVDFTGISKVVDAFKKEVCTEPGQTPPALNITF